ncbi:MAG: hypothetical protein R3C97_02885 [Geminicoccaceae bacterium]
MIRPFCLTAAAAMFALSAGHVLAHGDVAPQPVNTDELPDIGEDWVYENPYRAETAGEDVWATAVRIGSSGFNQNCARCHGSRRSPAASPRISAISRPISRVTSGSWSVSSTATRKTA